jgi:hemerythrin
MSFHAVPLPAAHAGWHDGLRLGHEPTDRAHEEFMALIATLEQVTNNGLPLTPALDALAAHAEAHFEAENASMAESAFPARACHVSEHEAVLRSIEGVRRRVAQGEHAPARTLARELAAWFPAHCDYLDAALVHWLCTVRCGGKPVVVRRRLPGPIGETAC